MRQSQPTVSDRHDDSTHSSRIGALLTASALVAAAATAARADAVPTFGGVTLVTSRLDLLTSTGGSSFEIVGNAVAWSVLEPNGHDFDANALRSLDQQVRVAAAAGLEQIVVRVRPGGGPMAPFAGDPSTWPVDSATYDQKEGEYLGPKYAFGTYSYPPRVLTRDDSGQTSPWYDFVYALAKRYDGTTVDPQTATKKLPRVAAWSCVEEPDVKSYWYGTGRDYFGGVNGDPAVGTLPSFYRAVKAANPAASVVGAALTSHQVGFYMAHEMARAEGNAYDATVRAWGTSYFNSNYPMQRVFATNIPDAQLYTQQENDPEARRARAFIDSAFAGSAPSFYDVLGIHSYDNWSLLSDMIEWQLTRLDQPKRVWITELGFADVPPRGTATLVSDADQPAWLVKKLVLALAAGVEHTSYSPMLAAPGFASLYPSTTSERPARRSMQLIGQSLNQASGYRFGSSFVSGGTTFYVFDHADGASHIAVAWRDSDSATQHTRPILGIPSGATVRVLDDLEHVVSTSNLNLTFGVQPLVIEWGPAVVDADGDGYPAGIDCDDQSSAVNPGATEGGADSRDNDCDPITQ